jgi:large subunit ribosomal protein L17
MRHHSNTRKFGREKTQRHALLRSLGRNLIRDGKIRTTLAKAKEVRPFVEKLITSAKSGTVAGRRIVNARIQGPTETKKLFDVLAPKYMTRKGGYTRIVKLPNRVLDGAAMAIIEFV